MKNRNALSMVELLVVIAIIGILVMLLLPALDRGRGRGHRTMCNNSLRQIALAMTNYHSAHQHFPSCTGIEGFNAVGSSNQLGALVQILPYMDAAEMYKQITEGSTIRDRDFSPFPALDDDSYQPWVYQNPIFRCGDVPQYDTGFGKTDYGLCVGDRARNIATPESARGAFGGSRRLSFAEIDDGSSNTIMAGEIGARTRESRMNRYAISQPVSILESPVECFELINRNDADWQFNRGVSLSSLGRGGHWADGRAGPALFNTILPPNSPSVSMGEIGADGIYSASSPHSGGVNIARLDGSTAFIDENIDASDSSAPTPSEEEMTKSTPSPYGVWGALGTINGGEIVSDF